MPTPEKHVEPPSQISGYGCLVRLGWMFVGNVLLVLCAIAIAQRGRSLSWVDAAFWALIASLLGLRYLDIARMGGQTATGQPASMSHWRRYVAFLLVFALALWFGAHAVAWFGR